MTLRTTNQGPQTARSWHHRMARLLILSRYRPACMAGGCPKIEGLPRAADYVCEWDQQQGGRTVSRRRLYCREHAAHFALKHRIYMAELPGVELAQLETASRDNWRYADDICHEGAKTPKQTDTESSCPGDLAAKEDQEEV